MASLDDLSLEELESLRRQKSQPMSLDDMSLEELESLRAQKSTQEPKSGVDLKALKVGAERGLTFGARPFIAGVAGGLGYGLDQMSQGKSGLEGFKTGFSEARKEAREEQERLAVESPKSFLLGEVGGALLMPGAAIKGITQGAKGIQGTARVGAAMGAGTALGEAENLGEAVESVGSGAVLGAGGELLAKGAGAATTAIQRKLEQAAANNALRAAGAKIRDLRGMKTAEGIYRTGKSFIDRGLVKAGDTVESISSKATELKDDAGKALESIYNFARKQFPGTQIPGFNPVKNKTEILEAAKEKLGDSVDGSAALKKLSDYLDNLATKYGDNDLDPKTANNIKSAIDDAINYSRNPQNKQPDVEKAFQAARNFVSKKIDSSIDELGKLSGGGKVLDDLKEANRAYGTGSSAGNMAIDQERRELANKSLGLRQSQLIGAGAVTGGLISGDLEGAAKGATLGASLKTIEKYGPAILAQAEQRLADMIGKSSALRRMVNKNPAAYQALLQNLLDQYTGPGGVPMPNPPGGPVIQQSTFGE